MTAPDGDTVLSRSMHADMLFVANGHSARESSWDRSGGNVDARPVSPGMVLELAAIPGAGVIRHFYISILGTAPDKPDYLQSLVLRAYWDGETAPSIETPVGDFFGQGHARINFFRSQMVAVNPGTKLQTDESTLTVGFNCYFPMPFGNGARLTLTIQSARNLAEYASMRPRGA
jgi:hypothetical protein